MNPITEKKSEPEPLSAISNPGNRSFHPDMPVINNDSIHPGNGSVRSHSGSILYKLTPTIIALLVYILLSTALFIWSNLEKDGPNDVPLWYILILLLPVISGILLWGAINQAAKGHRRQIIPAIIHGVVLVGTILLLLTV